MFGILKNIFRHPDANLIKDALKNGALLVDVRTAAEFASGSVNGAINIPLDKIPAQLKKIGDRKSIVVFCMSGNRSAQAKSILERNGFRNVINGGTWQNVKSLIQ